MAAISLFVQACVLDSEIEPRLVEDFEAKQDSLGHGWLVVTHGREIIVESSESAADVEKELLSSIGTGGDGVFTVTDERGRRVLIPVGKIAYVDLGEENARHVGFGAV